MSIPKFFDFFGPTLEVLRDDETKDIKTIRAIVSDKMKLTEDQKNIMLSSGKQATYVNRIAWSVAYLKKAGLLDSVDTSLCKHICPQRYAPDLNSSDKG